MRARDSASEVRETLSAYSIFQKGILTLHGKIGFFNVSLRNKWKCIYLCFYFMIGFLWCWYLHKYFFDVVRNKLQAINIYTRVDKKKIKSSRKEYVIRTCFKFWTTKNISETISQWEFDYGLLTDLPRILSLATFLRVHSNSKVVF